MDIVLSTLNARYHHSAFGLRYLHANLGEYQTRSEILEFTTKKPVSAVVTEILSRNPRIVGFGVYIWNVRELTEVVRQLKIQRPEVCVVLGGPEVSYETELQEICHLADHVICGEADHLFRDFCANFLSGGAPSEKIIRGPRPSIQEIVLPYSLYTDEDIRNRVIYVEASRGCPYRCEYCLSSLDEKVRDFDVDQFLLEIAKLMERGARTFKFVDRTFNLSMEKSRKILEFFLARIELGLFLHFELVPDRLPEELRLLIARFPKGSLQFEIGVQTMNPKVAALISRRQNYTKIQENFKFLREHTGIHTHADLIVGLPGEDLETFGQGFDRLVAHDPDEIQVGILKRLRGTPIIRHDKDGEVVWSQESPYQIQSNKWMSAETIHRMTVFADVWDLYWNSGRFPNFVQQVKRDRVDAGHSLFGFVLSLADHFWLKFQRTHSVSLENQFLFLQEFGKQSLNLNTDEWSLLLARDYLREGRTHLPQVLRLNESDWDLLQAELPQPAKNKSEIIVSEKLPDRQRRRQEKGSAPLLLGDH